MVQHFASDHIDDLKALKNHSHEITKAEKDWFKQNHLSPIATLAKRDIKFQNYFNSFYNNRVTISIPDETSFTIQQSSTENAHHNIFSHPNGNI